jgi:hypothetical protein
MKREGISWWPEGVGWGVLRRGHNVPDGVARAPDPQRPRLIRLTADTFVLWATMRFISLQGKGAARVSFISARPHHDMIKALESPRRRDESSRVEGAGGAHDGEQRAEAGSGRGQGCRGQSSPLYVRLNHPDGTSWSGAV